MPATSFFHGVTVTLVDTGPRSIATPSSSVIGLVDTYTPGANLAAPNTPVKITSLREAAAAFGTDGAIYQSLRAIYARTSAVVAAVGVAKAADAAAQTTAIIGGVTAQGARTGLSLIHI